MLTLDEIAIRALGVFPEAKIDDVRAEDEVIYLSFEPPLVLGEWTDPISGIWLHPWPYEEGFDVEMFYSDGVRDNDMIGIQRQAANELIRRVHQASALQWIAGAARWRAWRERVAV